MTSPAEPAGAVTLRELLLDNLVAKFSLEDIEDLCFRLGIEADNLSGDTRAKKARQLILFLERYGRLAELIALGQRLRPDLIWEVPVRAGLGEQKAAPAPSDTLILETPFHLELVRVPAGEFWMGSDLTQDGYALLRELPRHRVYVSEFYIGKYPVTNAQYAAYAWLNDMPFDLPTGKGNHPVVKVSWDEAVAFCQWMSQAAGRTIRLPTEAEWEKAARGTDGRIYPWAGGWDPGKLNGWAGGVHGTTPVGKYSPAGDSPYGAADMAGNVDEWVADWYDENAYKEHVKSGSPVKDPTGPMRGEFRVVRGGSFYVQGVARAASRGTGNPNDRPDSVGFRVVSGPTPAS